MERNHSGSDPQPIHDTHDNPSKVLHIRTTIPVAWAVQLNHILADLRIPKAEAIREAVVLYIRYHGHGQGVALPDPLPPVSTKKEVSP
jgi:hypothetical protein